MNASLSPRLISFVVESSSGVVTDTVADNVGVVTDVTAVTVSAETVPVVVIEPSDWMLCVCIGWNTVTSLLLTSTTGPPVALDICTTPSPLSCVQSPAASQAVAPLAAWAAQRAK